MKSDMLSIACSIGMLSMAGCANGMPETQTADPVSAQELLGTVFVKADGATVGAEAIEGKSVIALYFSAQWCPPCRQFTPLLVKAAVALQEQGKPFAVVFVSSDRSRDDMLKYMRDYNMPWVALPHGDARKAELASRYGIRGIPALIVIDGEGKTITTQGRQAIAAQGAAAFDDWVGR